MAALLGRLTAARHRLGPDGVVPPGYLGGLLRAFRPAGSHRVQPADLAVARGLIEPLSTREMEVLGLLAAGRPNQSIADELVVTVETVKKHVSHILGKLGAANRTQAVAVARQLGLLT
jgi:LuxR family maltose regulon positive regulatory protein